MSTNLAETTSRRIPKKDQILTLFKAGITEVADLAAITKARTSYVASVLHEAEQIPGYFDLYTSTRQPMNVYSKFFAGQLSYRDEAAAHKSVALLDNFYRQFEIAGDRAGQHHALLLGLTIFDRARWTGKTTEAAIYRDWLKERMDEEPPTRALTKSKPR